MKPADQIRYYERDGTSLGFRSLAFALLHIDGFGKLIDLLQQAARTVEPLGFLVFAGARYLS